tara:strand:+ start:117 stop:383 length:267 start_codon:yes stop_codon:yes gene_type:complete
MKRKVLDSWKRPIEIEVEDTSDRIPQQLNFNFGPRDATPEEFEEWRKSELDWWGDRQLKFIALAVLVQFGALVFMFTTFFVISLGLGK